MEVGQARSAAANGFRAAALSPWRRRPPAGATILPLGRIFLEGSRRRKRKWHVEGPVEAPVSKCRRFWKVLLSKLHKAERLGPPLLDW